MSANLFTYVIDVSHNNGVISWPTVKASRDPIIKGAYIKATEGVTFKDPLLTRNAAGAAAAKIAFGCYHYAHTKNDPTKEAQFFAKVLKTLTKSSLVPMLDIEENDGNLSAPALENWIKTFVAALGVLGYKCGVYTYGAFVRENLPPNHTLGNLPFWFSHITSLPLPILPPGFSKFNLWQFTYKAKVPGVPGEVDLSKTAPELIRALEISGIAAGVLLLLIIATILILNQ